MVVVGGGDRLVYSKQCNFLFRWNTAEILLRQNTEALSRNLAVQGCIFLPAFACRIFVFQIHITPFPTPSKVKFEQKPDRRHCC